MNWKKRHVHVDTVVDEERAKGKERGKVKKRGK